MIPRYSHPEMAAIWSEENKMATWLQVELAVCEAWSELGVIPPEALAQIFERFYRVEAARTSAGAGLGLAIAKELIEAQGGVISVESVVGQGSTFTVRLPQMSEGEE